MNLRKLMAVGNASGSADLDRVVESNALSRRALERMTQSIETLKQQLPTPSDDTVSGLLHSGLTEVIANLEQRVQGAFTVNGQLTKLINEMRPSLEGNELLKELFIQTINTVNAESMNTLTALVDAVGQLKETAEALCDSMKANEDAAAQIKEVEVNVNDNTALMQTVETLKSTVVQLKTDLDDTKAKYEKLTQNAARATALLGKSE